MVHETFDVSRERGDLLYRAYLTVPNYCALSLNIAILLTYMCLSILYTLEDYKLIVFRVSPRAL